MILRSVTSTQRLSLLTVLGLGLIVRLVRIDSRGTQYDDAFSIFLSSSSIPDIIRGTAADTMPPLYYLALHYWMQVSQEVWYLRLLSVGLSLLAVFLLYHWVLELTNDLRAAFFAGLLMAISPFQYYHAQDVRNYALLLCAQLGYMLFFTRIWKSNRKGLPYRRIDWIGLVLCALAGMYTHNVAVLAFALPNIFLLLKRQWRLFGQLILAQAVVGILVLPWMIQLPQQLAKVQTAWWLWRPGLVDVLQIPVVWSAGLPLPGVLLFVGVVVGIEILALLFLEVWRGRKDPGIFMLALTVGALPLIFFGLSYVMRPIFVPRGFVLASAAYLGLAGWAISRGWEYGTGKILLGGFILTAAIGVPVQASFANFPRSPFEAVGAQLVQQLQPEEMVLHDNKLSFFPMRFYQPGLRQQFLPDAPGSANDNLALISQQAMQIFPAEDLESAVGTSKGVYFVVFSEAINEYKALSQEQHPVIEWLSKHYQFVSRTAANDLEVFYFVRP